MAMAAAVRSKAVTSRLVRELANSQNTAAKAATQALDQLWAKTGQTMTPEALRDFMLKSVPALVREYGSVASLAARTWYERARGDMGDGFKATGGAASDSKAIRGSVRWAMGPAFTDTGDGAGRETTHERLAQVVDRHVRQAGQDTLARNIRRDGKAKGWAIVPQGATCAWCTMLASRADLDIYYRSEETAARSVHDHCDCQIVPDWGGGFDSETTRRIDRMYLLYRAGREEAGKGATTNEILAAMRRVEGENAARFKNHVSILTDAIGLMHRPRKRDSVAKYAPQLEKLRTMPAAKSLAEITHADVNPGWDDEFGEMIDDYMNAKTISAKARILRRYLVHGNNCQRVAYAAELRMRGIDVRAMPKGEKVKDNYQEFYSAMWHTKDGKRRKFTSKATNQESLDEMVKYPVGSRFLIRGSWEKGGGGHIWNAQVETDADGNHVVRMYDFQEGDRNAIAKKAGLRYKVTDPNDYPGDMKDGSVAFLRVDDMLPDDTGLTGTFVYDSGTVQSPESYVCDTQSKPLASSKAKKLKFNDQPFWKDYDSWPESTP